MQPPDAGEAAHMGIAGSSLVFPRRRLVHAQPGDIEVVRLGRTGARSGATDRT
jgi:hypothetical protein